MIFFSHGTRMFHGTRADTKEPVVVFQYKGNLCAFPHQILLEAADALCEFLMQETRIAKQLKETKGLN